MDNTRKPREPFIAVIGQWRPEDPEFGKFPIPYAHAVERAGGIPYVLSTFKMKPDEANPENIALRTDIDPSDASDLDGAIGLVIPGGGDIDPEWYGRKLHPRTKQINHQRDRFELTLLEEALERDMPVLAICHGMQLLTVQQGGTLDQHLADHEGILEHDRDRPRAEAAHGLRIKAGSLLAEVFEGERGAVNSHHHQGLGNVPPSLEEIAWADDGVLEAVSLRDRSWVVGVQWHPEAMAPLDRTQLALFERFIEAAQRYGEREERAPRSA